MEVALSEIRKCRRHTNADYAAAYASRRALALDMGLRAAAAAAQVRALHSRGQTGPAAMWGEIARITASEAVHHALFLFGRPERKHIEPRRKVGGKRLRGRKP